MKKNNGMLIILFTLALCAGVLSFATSSVYASDSAETEALTVDGVWLEGDMLHIEVTDRQTGINQTLELSLSDYAGNSEYVSVQAVDKSGNKSNTINFKNPFYIPEAEPEIIITPDQSESAVPDGYKPLTPDGSGTVVDNVTDGDGKEFFTITTDDGNVFYMIIDRQRSTDNVYLLNAVTEDDLFSLAAKGDGKSTSAIPDQTTSEQYAPPTSTAPSETEPSAPDNENDGINRGTLIFIIVAAVVVGVAGYYFKVIRPKKDAADDTDEIAEEYEDYGDDYGDSGEEGDGE